MGEMIGEAAGFSASCGSRQGPKRLEQTKRRLSKPYTDSRLFRVVQSPTKMEYD